MIFEQKKSLEVRGKMIIFGKDKKYFEISKFSSLDLGQLWIENELGEGLEVSEKQFFEIVEKFFNENL